MNIEQARFNMIEQQIRPWDVLDKGVLGLLAIVRREDFVPAAYKALAFVDTEVPLPEGESMLAPRVEARMLQDLQVQRHERVLEIGAGSGFMAALLGHRAQSVISLEVKPALARLATENLRRTEVNVERMEADKMDRIADTDIAGSNEDYRADFRRDWENRYAGAGATWETYQPAYEYGYRTAGDPRYRGRDWSDVEDDLRTDYLRSNPNSTWDRMKGAVRYGWEKVTGKR